MDRINICFTSVSQQNFISFLEGSKGSPGTSGSHLQS
jgi:hypothetical protein